MTQTPHYHLSQWAKADRIEMEDFNGDNAKLDAALEAHDAAIAARATTAALDAETAARTAAVSAETAARTSAVTAEENARKQADTALQTAINKEVSDRKAAIAAEASARTSAVATLNTAVAKLGNCQLYYTTYVGAGTAAQGSPRTFTFPHPPRLVLLADATNRHIWAIPGMTILNVSNYEGYQFSWSGNSFSFWGNAYNLDSKGTTYSLVALLDASK